MESCHSIAIVGAGLSGLYAAHLLRTRFPDVVVLEAQHRVGGRIKQIEGMTPWPIEAGPEFVHGSNSIFVELASQLGVQFSEKEWPNWWYFGQDKKLVTDEEVDDEVNKVHELFDNCCDEQHPPPGQDVSAAEWMQHHGCTDRQVAVAEACYANDFGCSLQQLGLREMIEENRGWDSGETYLLMDRSMGCIPRHLAQGLHVRTNWPVTRVEYDQGGALLRCADGRAVRCQKVLVTVPLQVLQDNVITFQPQLPQPKLQAMSRVKMGNVVKLVLTFKARFWPDDMYDVVCTKSFVPEFWMLRYPATQPSAGQQHCVVGFVAGDKAAAISSMDPQVAVKTFLGQLDAIFASDSNSTPASSSFAESQIVDWSKDPWVRGAYSYPSLGAELGDREQLGASVVDTLFFAGEATNTALNPCIQGAMQTAKRAALQIEGCMARKPASRL